MKAYQAERKFLYFEKRHFLFLSRMSFLCMRRSDPQERRSRTLKTGIDFKPNSKTFRYILNHNNNKKLRKLCLSRFCACSAIPTCLLSDINPCGISPGDASELCSKIILNPQQNSNKTHFLESSDMCVWVIVNIRWLWWDCDCETRLGQSSVEDWPVAQSEYWSQGIVGVAKSCRSGRYICFSQLVLLNI